MGLDYDLSFTPRFDRDGPYVLCSSTRLLAAAWQPAGKKMRLELEGATGEHGAVHIAWRHAAPSPETLHVTIGGKPAALKRSSLRLPGGQEAIAVEYSHQRPKLVVEIQQKGS